MKKYISVFIYFFFTHLLFADNTIVDHYSFDNGLPHNNVNCVMKSSDGFLWIGTWYGLCSFDGKEIKTYNNPTNFQIDSPPRRIQDIIEDDLGNLWIKTIDHKLYIFDKRQEQFHFVSSWLPREFSINAQIIKVTKTDNGDFLLLTKDKDLLLAFPCERGMVEIKLLYKSDVKVGDSKLKKNIINETSDYIIWVGMDFSTISFEKDESLRDKGDDYFLKRLSEISDSPFCCAYIFDSILWLADENGCMFSLNSIDGTIKSYDSFVGIGEIENIIQNNHSGLYVVIKQEGIYEFNLANGEAKELLPLQKNIINSFRDDSGILWFVTNSSDVISYNPVDNSSHVIQFPYYQQINERLIWADGGGFGLFFITVSGEVYQVDRKEMSVKQLNLNQNSKMTTKNKFSDILFDNRGVMWLTSYDDGMFQVSFPEKQFYLFNPLMGFNSVVESRNEENAVKALFKDDNGDVWIGSRSSEVFQFDKNGILKNRFSSKNYNIGNVYHIMKDWEGTYWFSTKGQGLVNAVPDDTLSLNYRFERFQFDSESPNSISHNDVYFTFQDSKGRIWVATFGGGLNLLQREEGRLIFKHKYNSFSNYPDYGRYMEVRTINEDRNGRIWVGTSDGLMTFDGDFLSPQKIDFEIFSGSQFVSNNDIYYLYKDKSEGLWASVFGVGLKQISDYNNIKKTPSFKSYGTRQGLRNDVVLSLIEDDNNNLWLSTESGIAQFNMDSKLFRNFDAYDGLSDYKLGESSALYFDNNEIWFGSKEGIVRFNPADITENQEDYPTYIIDIKVSNKNYDEWSKKSTAVKYLDKIVLKHNQSMFSIEFAALNYFTQNHISYNYILEGYEKEWHLNGQNRIASYTNVPHGKYIFRVKTIDETNPDLFSEKTLEIKILPPWWRSVWAYITYAILLLILMYFLWRHASMVIRMKNDIYVQQELSDLKIKFFTNVSHELRTPLTLIKGPIVELKENEKLSSKGMRYMDLMEKNTNQMLNLVNQILDFRKIENKKMQMHVSKFDLNKLVKSFYDEFYHLSVENEISFDYHLLEEDIYVWADYGKIETVIRNIISNAFKFTNPGGSILITSGVNEKEQICFLQIEDSGVGISKSKLEEIFERFSQSESHQPGTGIGLALSKELMIMHHGAIKVDSNQDKGSVFTVELPLGKEHFQDEKVEFYLSDSINGHEMPDDYDTAEEDSNESEKDVVDPDVPAILIVEDNKSLRDLLRMQLEDEFTVHTAADGEIGLKKVHLFHPDIVITDQMMPNVTGLELLEQIRRDFQISHIPVIVLTAKNDDDSRIRALNLGANAYITKPFSKRHLIVRVNQLLNDRKIFREKLWESGEGDRSENNYGEYLISKDKEFLDDIHEVIEDNIDNLDFNIDQIAVSLNLSRSAFFKKLKSITGLSPVDLVKEIRLNKSIELIKNTDLNISEIAFAVGFRDSGYFGKCFKKKFKMTPREYTNAHRS